MNEVVRKFCENNDIPTEKACRFCNQSHPAESYKVSVDNWATVDYGTCEAMKSDDPGNCLITLAALNKRDRQAVKDLHRSIKSNPSGEW